MGATWGRCWGERGPGGRVTAWLRCGQLARVGDFGGCLHRCLAGRALQAGSRHRGQAGGCNTWPGLLSAFRLHASVQLSGWGRLFPPPPPPDPRSKLDRRREGLPETHVWRYFLQVRGRRALPPGLLCQAGASCMRPSSPARLSLLGRHAASMCPRECPESSWCRPCLRRVFSRLCPCSWQQGCSTCITIGCCTVT